MLSSRWSRASSLQMSSSTSLRMQAVPSLLFELEVCCVLSGLATPSHACSVCMHAKESPALRQHTLTGWCHLQLEDHGLEKQGRRHSSRLTHLLQPLSSHHSQVRYEQLRGSFPQPATQRCLPAWLCKHAPVHPINIVQCTHLISTSTPIVTHRIHAAATPHPTPLTLP